MAVLTSDQLTLLRQRAAQFLAQIDYTKAEANTVLQAIETWMTNGFTTTPTNSLNAAINAATSPKTLTAEQKRIFGAVWAINKARAEGVL